MTKFGVTILSAALMLSSVSAIASGDNYHDDYVAAHVCLSRAENIGRTLYRETYSMHPRRVSARFVRTLMMERNFVYEVSMRGKGRRASYEIVLNPSCYLESEPRLLEPETRSNR